MAFWRLFVFRSEHFLFSASILEKTCHYLLCVGEIDDSLISGFFRDNVIYFGHGYIVIVWNLVWQCVAARIVYSGCFKVQKQLPSSSILGSLRNYPSKALNSHHAESSYFLYCKSTGFYKMGTFASNRLKELGKISCQS